MITAMLLLITIAICLYVVVGGLIWSRATERVVSMSVAAKLANPTVIRLLLAALTCLHGLLLYCILYRNGYAHGAINLALGNVVSLVAWMTLLLFLLASMRKQTLNLGLVVIPFGLLGLLIGWLFPGAQFLLADLPQGIGNHIAIAIPAYGILSIAFAQALLLWIQEKQLRKPNPGSFFPALPAIETMESNLFQLTLLGFVLLSVNLITGMLNTQLNYGSLLLFNHHILLALLAWAGFGGLLFGHKFFGWRGQTAAKWTIAAFIILALAYFGTRFVRGVIL